MKVPLTWLREYVDVKIDLDELAHRLTMAGNEVDAIERFGHIENVVVGEVLEVKPHPNADRLRLVTVNDGEGVHEVVCGAPNVADGQKIAYASIGAQLVDPYSDTPGKTRKLRRSKIRGVESSGMVCSEKELGIGEDHDGILVLTTDAEIGTPIGEVIGDAILELELTPNRPDCLGVVGIARDVAALTGETLKLPPLDYPSSGIHIDSLAKVTVADADLSPRYLGGVVRDLQIKPSPSWLQERLIALGERPINNVVDATNFVMFEFGQPLHAFDYDKVVDHHVIVRRAAEGEKLTTLDGVERAMNRETLLITDPERGIGLAGIMGGANTEISESTVNVFLEAANFNPQNNRRTAGALGMRSEATLRFEKGLRAELAKVAIKRCLRVIQQVAGGEIAPGLIDEWPGKGSEQTSVDLTMVQIQRVMGVEYPIEQVESTLSALGFEFASIAPRSGQSEDRGWRVEIPYWRSDISIPEDLIEELARIIGYDDLPATRLAGRVPRWEPGAKHLFRSRVVDALTGYGMRQTITYAAVSQELEDKAPDVPRNAERRGDASGLALENPVSSNHARLRQSLRAPTLESAARNTRTWRGPVAVFESGLVFGPKRDGDPLPSQVERLTGVMTGPRNEAMWGRDDSDFDFYDAKGAVEHVLEVLGIEPRFIPLEDVSYAAGKSAEVLTAGRKGNVVGSVGVVDPAVWASFDPETPSAVMFELDMETLRSLIGDETRADRYSPFPRYPDAPRDLALIADIGVQVGDALRICQQNRLVKSASVFDVYEGGNVGADKKSIGIRVIYQSDKQTLTSDQVTRAEEQILVRLEKELGVTLRA